MSHFTEDTLRRIMINPFYAITVASQLTTEHTPSMSEAEWVRTNASLMGEMGAERWLRQLLEVLEGRASLLDRQINPSLALNIDPKFAAEHPPLIERDRWVGANIMQIREMGTEGWLMLLLDVLDGDILTAEAVGLPPPSSGWDEFGVPSRYRGRRWGKQKRRKRPEK